MNSRTVHTIALGYLIVALSGILWAQTPAAVPDKVPPAAASAMPASSAQPAAPSATKPHDDSFVIGNDDRLTINVWNESEISRTLPVRSDGRISLPLVGEVQASGRTPLQLEQDIAGKLQAYITKPEVTVIVEQINSEKFNILGQVTKPGSYPLTAPTTVLDAIAAAGGVRDFAKQKGIYILRHGPNGSETRIPFNYKEVIQGKNSEQNIMLQPNDTIVVP
jgi:polysaccharide export outer membrane protein